MMQKTVTLNPGESADVSFSIKPAEVGTYTVKIGDLTGQLLVHPQPEAVFSLTNLVISPAEIYLGETASVSVTVTNIGDIAGTYVMVLEVM